MSQRAELPIASMHAPPAVPDKIVAFATRGADKLLLAMMRRMFMTNDRPELELEFPRTVARLQRYLDPELLADPGRLMAPVDDPLPKLRPIRRGPLRPRQLRGQLRAQLEGRREIGIDEHLYFDTPYQPYDPEFVAEYERYPELHRGYVWAWRHLEPAPATVLLTHGWGVGPWWIHRHEYDVPYLFHALGLDVYFYQAPYHGLRKPAGALSGQLHPSPDLVRTNEAFIQTAIELRTLISFILRRNPAPLGMMGSSLGGYTSALLASLDDRLDFVIPILPPASMAHVLWDHGDDDPMRDRAEAMGMSRERFHRFWSLHSPLSHTPKVPWGRRLIITGLGDTVITEAHTRDLWEHWQRPRHFRFPGGHAWQVQRRRYHKEIGRFLADLGLIPRLVK